MTATHPRMIVVRGPWRRRPRGSILGSMVAARDTVAAHRLAAAQEAMAQAGLDALLLATGTNLCFLSGYPVVEHTLARPWYLLLPRQGAPALVVHSGSRARGPDAVLGARRAHVRAALGRAGRRARRRPCARSALGTAASAPSSAASSASASRCSSSTASGRRSPARARGRVGRCSGSCARSRRPGTSRPCAGPAPPRRRPTRACSPIARAGDVRAGHRPAHAGRDARAPAAGAVGRHHVGHGPLRRADGFRHRPTLEPGDMVWMDCGCTVDGLWSDFGRAGVVGGPTPEQTRRAAADRRDHRRWRGLVAPAQAGSRDRRGR